MKYVDLCNNKVSRLGFGCMRLPEDSSGIDYIKAMEMADYAIKEGINYFDTAYVYHNGESETFVKKVLEKHGREKIFVADKLPIYDCTVKEDMDRFLDEQLERLGTDHIDYYLFHSLREKYFNSMKEFDYHDFIKRNKENGKIKHIGFSFHDDLDLFKEIIDDYDWDFCQIQFNYIDTDYQAGLEGYNYATNKGIPVIIMEPIRGGRLAKVPRPVREVFDSKFSDYTDALIALKYVADYPNAQVILSGMRTMSDLVANTKLFSDVEPDSLSEEEKELYLKAKEILSDYQTINCTGCDYCKEGCPVGINISKIFTKFNDQLENPWQNEDDVLKWYKELESKADVCLECGACEGACPQKLDIINKLKIVDKYFNK